MSDEHTHLWRKWPGLITKGVQFLQDNTRGHTADHAPYDNSAVLPHPPYGLDLVMSSTYLDS